MTIESRLADARSLAAQKRFDEAIAEYEYVLDIDPANAEAIAALDKLRGATSLRGSLAGSQEKPLKTDFFSHQAQEMSKPITQQTPVLVVMIIVGAGLLYGLYSAVMFWVNFDKNMAMKNVQVQFAKPVQKDGVATVGVEVSNFNPASIRDATISYTVSDSAGAKLASGQFTASGTVPAGDSRTFSDIKLGHIEGQAGRMHAELVDIKYGKKPTLAPELQVKFIEAAAMKDDEAVDAFKDICQAAPEFAPAFVGLGQSLAAAGDFDLAIKAFEKAIKIDPENENAHYNLGVALFYKKDYEGARKQFEEAARLEPDDPSVAKNLKRLELMMAGSEEKPPAESPDKAATPEGPPAEEESAPPQ